MGIHNLRHIVSELLSSGLPPITPIAVIQQATVKGQRYLRSSLKDVVSQVENKNFESPSIVIVGAVVSFQVEACAPPASSATKPISF